jgi:hypothetical protein
MIRDFASLAASEPLRAANCSAMSLHLRLSIASNVVLLGLLLAVWQRGSQPDSSSLAAGGVTAVDPESATRRDWVRPAAERPAGGQISPDAVAQLEQMGIARSIIVSALLEDFRRRWDDRFNQLQRKYAPKQVPERELLELARQRDAEQERELRQALGHDGYIAWDKERTLQAVNSAGIKLTPSEENQVYRLQKEFELRYNELQMAMEDGIADKADAAALQQQAQDELDRKLERALGKQRVAEMRGISDPMTDVYRKFGDLNPSSVQVDAVLAADRSYESREAELIARLKSNPGARLDVSAELKALREERDEHLRRVFGSQAYEAAQRQNDATYKLLTQYAEAWALRSGEVETVYAVVRAHHHESEHRRAAAQLLEAAGQSVDWVAINRSIDESRQKAEAELLRALGPDRLRRLKQNGVLTMH